MSDLGTAQNYLGVEIEHHPLGLFLHQREYIKKLLEKFDLQNCNSARLPMDPKAQLQKNMGSPSVNSQLYRSLVGSLIYLTNTRSDICYALSCVSRYIDKPKEIHLTAAKRILWYLSGTSDYGLFLLANNNSTLNTFADVDWGRDIDTNQSTSGILHKLGDSSIYWVSKMQPTVSLSTTKVEYRVLTDASKDIIYFRRLLAEIGIENPEPTSIMSDNQSCIRLVENPVLHSRTKHIGLQYHFIREASKSGEVHVNYIPTTYQQVDFHTKSLPKTYFLLIAKVQGLYSSHLLMTPSTSRKLIPNPLGCIPTIDPQCLSSHLMLEIWTFRVPLVLAIVSPLTGIGKVLAPTIIFSLITYRDIAFDHLAARRFPPRYVIFSPRINRSEPTLHRFSSNAVSQKKITLRMQSTKRLNSSANNQSCNMKISCADNLATCSWRIKDTSTEENSWRIMTIYNKPWDNCSIWDRTKERERKMTKTLESCSSCEQERVLNKKRSSFISSLDEFHPGPQGPLLLPCLMASIVPVYN